MKTLTKTVYVAFDDTHHDTEAACKAHERENAHHRLIGLTLDQVTAALTREDLDLGDAIEAVAYEISKRRKAAGDLKRRPSQAEAPEAPTGPRPTPSPGMVVNGDDDDETACTTCGVMFTGEDGQAECDSCGADSLQDARDAAGDAAHERARDRRAEGEAS